jgi:hypothetical protein
MTTHNRCSDNPRVNFHDLFDLEVIQNIQDAFAVATGVASIITDTNGVPITQPSNFCDLCQNVIRKTDKGLANCYTSDAILGQVNTGANRSTLSQRWLVGRRHKYHGRGSARCKLVGRPSA